MALINILIAFFSLIFLVVLHELGHFLWAKKFGVKVEEFGIGYPPRLFGKKVGETLYSINLLPFGAFVKLLGEEENNDDARSFSKQSVGKRSLIILGGVISFWITAAVLFSIVFNMGARMAVEDTDTGLKDPNIQITGVALDSPASKAGLTIGDTVIKIKSQTGQAQNIDKVNDFQSFIDNQKGQEIVLTIQRGNQTLDLKMTPRVSPPDGQGPLGVALTRTAIKKYSWYGAIWQGISATGNLTLAIFEGYYNAIKNVILSQPTGVSLTGPVGILSMASQAGELGVSYFLHFIGLISLYLAVFNILPIPAFDGGKLLFLGIEAVRKKPVSPKIEQNITVFFFAMLIILAIFVTIKDVQKIF